MRSASLLSFRSGYAAEGQGKGGRSILFLLEHLRKEVFEMEGQPHARNADA